MQVNIPVFQLYLSGTMMLLLLVAYISVFLAVYKQKQIRTARIYNESITKARLEAQQTAMNNLARELHDHIKHKLRLCRQQMNNISNLCTHETQRDIIEAHKVLLEDITKEVTDFSRALYYETKDTRNIRKWLVHEVNQVNSCGIIFCWLQVSDTLPEFDMYSEVNLIRIVQEGIQNTLKHAHATNLYIELNCRNEELELRIYDDGVGMAGEVPQTAFGLPGMADRVARMGGNMQFKSAPDQGTLILIHIPLPIEVANGEPAVQFRNEGF